MKTKSLRVKSLELINFRCFERISLTLHPRLNVFFGVNGAGKSAIIEAINIMLGYIVGTIGQNAATKINISGSDIANDKNNSSITISIIDSNFIKWSAKAKRTIKDGGYGSETTYDNKKLEQYIQKIVHSIIVKNGVVDVPLFVSYKATRRGEVYFQDQPNFDFSSRSCYDDAISRNADFYKFFSWFKEREDLENENLLRQLKVGESAKQQPDSQLQAVRNALHTFFPAFSNFSIQRQTRSFVVTKNNTTVNVEQLSDGEKGFILLVGDIARRLAIANPTRINPLEGEGVVLIDEIELHLHPKWQRMVIPQLLKTFPNCQFIVSTHSPQVLGEVQAESIWLLAEGEQPTNPPLSYGLDSNEILEGLMGAKSRNEEVTATLEGIDRLIDDEQFDSARAAIRNLAKKIGGSNPALVGVNSSLTMLGQEQAKIEG